MNSYKKNKLYKSLEQLKNGKRKHNKKHGMSQHKNICVHRKYDIVGLTAGMN